MKITKSILKQLIRESISEITDLEAIGAEEAYGDDNSEEEEHIRNISKDREVAIEKIDWMLSDLAGIHSLIRKSEPDNKESLALLKEISEKLTILQQKL